MDKEKFTIKIFQKRRESDRKYYVEFIPDNEYERTIKKCDLIDQDLISDFNYLESVRVELFQGLSEAYGELFTSIFEL